MTTTTHTIRIDDVDIHVEERGAGAPLLLLHGLTGCGGDFVHLFGDDGLEALAATHRVIAPDARGHGRTTRGGGFTLRRCAADVLGLCDALGVERARAIGMSLGALTLLHVATRAPARVERMVLVSATPRFPDAALGAMRALGGLAAELAGAGPDDLDLDAGALSAITAETLVVAGDRDPLYPVELAVELYRGIPRAALYVVPGGGHAPVFVDERDAFARRALPFLQG